MRKDLFDVLLQQAIIASQTMLKTIMKNEDINKVVLSSSHDEDFLNTIASALKKFGDKVINDSKQIAKLFKEATAGSRVLPSRTSKNDAEYQCRIDMGEEVKDKPGYYNVYLQVNSQAKSEGLKDWLRKNPHGKLATSQVNRNAPENERAEEGKRVVEQLIEQAKKKI
ncbi:hypothetical protein KXV64_005440 [Aspergillus fumigatus]|nr:hypothetical protein KXW62_005162 [Aspergillus fumigatus]KAH3523608.1 hypothetical protein KXV64_005440 [Aspergillus fumigatus]